MNKLTKETNKKKVLDLVKRESLFRTSLGNAKCWKKTTYEHFRVLSDILWKLGSQGYDVYSEVEFKNGGRADLLVLDMNGNASIIEILHSETEERFEEKLSKYPFSVIKVRTKDFDIKKWDL